MSDSVLHAVAGAAGGIFAIGLTYPLIFISTRTAVQRTKLSKSTYEAILEVIKREGITGVYSGLSSSLLGIAITNGVYYYFYERSRAAFVVAKKGNQALSTLETMMMGLIAGSATTIISNPVWVIQTSQTVRTMTASRSPGAEMDDSAELRGRLCTTKKLGFIETARQIIRKDGITALWHGIGPALVLVMNPVLQYTVFEQLKNILIRRRRASSKFMRGDAILSGIDFFFLGALSKLVATSITYPYIVIKSRMQAGLNHKYKSVLDGLLTIIKEEGLEGLYKGIGSKLIQSVLTAAILFAGQRRIYELTKEAMSKML